MVRTELTLNQDFCWKIETTHPLHLFGNTQFHSLYKETSAHASSLQLLLLLLLYPLISISIIPPLLQSTLHPCRKNHLQTGNQKNFLTLAEQKCLLILPEKQTTQM
jgi:hypothetical protein